METIVLNIDHNTKPQNLAGALNKRNLQRGDTLSVKSWLDEEMVLLIVLIALAVFHHAKKDYFNKVLEDVFGDRDSRKLQGNME